MALTSDQAIQRLEAEGWSLHRDRDGYVVLDRRGQTVTKGRRAEATIAGAVERAVTDDQERRSRAAEQRARKLVLDLEGGTYPRSYLLSVVVDGEPVDVMRFRPARLGSDLDQNDYETAREALLAARGL